MNLFTVIGTGGMALIVMISIFTSGNAGGYFDVASIIITIFGSAFCVIAGTDKATFISAMKSIKLCYVEQNFKMQQLCLSILELAIEAKKSGFLSLEEKAKNIDDDFLKEGITLIIDGTDPALLKTVLETEVIFMDERHQANIAVYDYIAAVGPAFGMLGTLLGLINMLQNLSDPSTLGPQMAVAIVTTFYGVIIANAYAIPVANKLRSINNAEIFKKQVVIECLLSIQAGENPRNVEEKLKAFLSYSDREEMASTAGRGGDKRD